MRFSLWNRNVVPQINWPRLGGPWLSRGIPAGQLCWDITQPVNATNCIDGTGLEPTVMQFIDINGSVVPPSRAARFDFDLDTTVVHTQFTTIRTYSPGLYRNRNVTAGYRYTLDPLQETSSSPIKYHFPRCPAYASRTQGFSPCICLTLDCYAGDTVLQDAFVPFEPWTLTAPVQVGALDVYSTLYHRAEYPLYIMWAHYFI